MTRFLLIRHASNDTVGRQIAGRMPGVHLNRQGLAEVDRLVDRLAGTALDAIYSSPLERARETAGPVATKLGLDVNILEGLDEIDYGEWTGRALSELNTLERWKQYNLFRSGTRIPQGELMVEAQVRIVREIERLRVQHQGQMVALVSHGDVIRAGIAHYAGISLDLFQRIEISCASVSILAVDDYGARILKVNDTGAVF